MMGGETPETCWATHKRQAINLWNCCILLVELFESYDDARTYERQMFYNNCVFITLSPNQMFYSRLQCFNTYHEHRKAIDTTRVVAISFFYIL